MLSYIRSYYCVPAKLYARVRFEGRDGTIIGARGQYLRIRLDGDGEIRTIHPTWRVEYVESEKTTDPARSEP